MRKKNLPNHQDLRQTESGGWRKKWKGRIPVALLFPNSYHLGMSNLGFQLVYDIINQHPDFVCERVFLPEEKHRPLSIESHRPLSDFPLLFCSISFEQDYLNLLRMMLMGAIEPLAEKRLPHQVAAGRFPLVVGGGVATLMNPEPLSPFVDLFIIGDAEPLLPAFLDYLKEKPMEHERQDLLLKTGETFSSCYIPGHYNVSYKDDGTLEHMTGPGTLPERIRKAYLEKPSVAGHSKIFSSETEFADMFLTELGRGCTRGCRFCAAGFVYRPPRLWSAEKVVEALKNRPKDKSRVGLLGMEMAIPSDLEGISEYLMADGCSLSFSSLRADALAKVGLRKLLAESGLKSVALAPDGGSERLRKVINKGFKEKDILEAARFLFDIEVANLKLYFMIGLPSEQEADLSELVELVIKVREIMLAVGRPKGRLSSLTLSINCFVPKPWTPFQYAPFASVKDLKAKIKYIKKSLAGQANMKINMDPPDHAFFQAVLARGDRKVGMALLSYVQSEKNWRQLFRQLDVDPDLYALRERKENELFPWEILDHGITKSYLWQEYCKALEGRTTVPCDTSKCKRCGVCVDELKDTGVQ